jgi:hypothetical protein
MLFIYEYLIAAWMEAAARVQWVRELAIMVVTLKHGIFV